jgi:hypothetical protein
VINFTTNFDRYSVKGSNKIEILSNYQFIIDKINIILCP